jgi:hypothetical protein
MPRLHISQDETGYWQLTMEDDNGALTLLSHQFPTPDHLIEDARDLVAEGTVPDGVIVVGPPVAPATAAVARTQGYKRPAPRKAVP